jgi:hypothetical protein
MGACDSLAARLISALCARETVERMLRISLLVVRTYESVWIYFFSFDCEANKLWLNALHMLSAGYDHMMRIKHSILTCLSISRISSRMLLLSSSLNCVCSPNARSRSVSAINLVSEVSFTT